jgi:hypothetical protein
MTLSVKNNSQNASQTVVAAKKKSSAVLDMVVSEKVLVFLKKGDLKAFGCTNVLYRNLIYAYRGMNYVKAQNIIMDNRPTFVGRGNETRDEATEQTNLMRAESDFILDGNSPETGECNWLTIDIVNEESKNFKWMRVNAACAEHWQRGRCEEVAAIALVHIQQKISSEVVLSRYTVELTSDPEGTGHTAMVVGTAPNAVICDPWAGKVYSNSSRIHYLENFLGEDENDLPILTKFNPLTDTEHVDVIWTPPAKPSGKATITQID